MPFAPFRTWPAGFCRCGFVPCILRRLLGSKVAASVDKMNTSFVGD